MGSVYVREFVMSNAQLPTAMQPLPIHFLPLASQKTTEPIDSVTVSIALSEHAVRRCHSVLSSPK